MRWVREKWKSLMRNLRGESSVFSGKNIIFDEKRGKIRHQYSFSPVEECRAEHCRPNRFGTESVIRYHLMNYDENPDRTWVFLVEDTIHELVHWGLGDEKNSATRGDDGEHSVRWKKTIYPALAYVHENLEISENDK